MPTDEPQPPPEVHPHADESTAMAVGADADADAVPALAGTPLDAPALVQGLRTLQERIPGFVQLSRREWQSMLRRATLDPEFVTAGMATAGAWSETKRILHFTAEELRELEDEIGSWDEVTRELRVVLKGIESANLERRYRLGSAVMLLYRLLRITIDQEDRRHLRPYFEEMQRIARKTYKGRKRKAKPSGE